MPQRIGRENEIAYLAINANGRCDRWSSSNTHAHNTQPNRKGKHIKHFATHIHWLSHLPMFFSSRRSPPHRPDEVRAIKCILKTSMCGAFFSGLRLRARVCVSFKEPKMQSKELNNRRRSQTPKNWIFWSWRAAAAACAFFSFHVFPFFLPKIFSI